MDLVIVESPAKTRKIRDFLGSEFRVTACMGHFRDLPARGLGVDLDTLEATYEIHKQDVVDRLLEEGRDVRRVYLCTDPDREGEAIAWHIMQVLGPEREYRRATFQEITRKAVLAAVENPGLLRGELVRAQQARRILDRLVGYRLSPALWRAFPDRKSLSAGRVQSVALRLVAEREREIANFKEEIYFRVLTRHEKDGIRFKARLKSPGGQGGEGGQGGKEARFASEDQAREVADELEKASPFRVLRTTREEQRRFPQAPFTTADMQAKAANVLKLDAEVCMALAQKLYEEGHITYHRTDSTAIAAEALETLRRYILARYGEPYLPPKPHTYAAKAGAQEAHECIRPTEVADESPAGLAGDPLALYRLIRDQYVSCQMAPGLDALSVVELEAGRQRLEARGREELFDGFRCVNRGLIQEKSRAEEESAEEEGQQLPTFASGEQAPCKGVEVKKCKTRPPPRYSQASLIKRLEKEGIGRPSTYAAILQAIYKRGYVKLVRRYYHAEALGIEVNDYLVGHFPRIVELSFTRRCEERLDAIASGELDSMDFLKKFRDYLEGLLREANRFAPASDSSTPRSTRRPPRAMGAGNEGEGRDARDSDWRSRPPRDRGSFDVPGATRRTEAGDRSYERPERPARSPRDRHDSGNTPRSRATRESVSPSCPACGGPTRWQESRRWPGRTFFCCHACRRYLETDPARRPLASAAWLGDAGG